MPRRQDAKPASAAWLVAATFLVVVAPPRVADAQSEQVAPEQQIEALPADNPTVGDLEVDPSQLQRQRARESRSRRGGDPPPPPVQAITPPAAGNEKSGASNQAISVPKGAGTIQGM